eukprot:scaffold16242_cov55-Attheya_sp.AAC.9
MAAEGEFAFVIAVFAVDKGLIDKDLYASVVFAVLLSTIFPPFLLRFTINYYNKKAEEMVRKAAEEQLEQSNDVEADGEHFSEELEDGIRKRSTIFVVIQTRSDSKWGLLNLLMAAMNRDGLEIIDHRSWHPRGVNTTLVNEVYAKAQLPEGQQDTKDAVDARFLVIQTALMKVIDQPGAKVKVQRWYPGVVKEITEKMESTHGDTKPQETKLNLQDRLLSEATNELEKHREMQTQLTKEKTVEDIRKELTSESAALPEFSAGEGIPTGKPKRRRRQKMRSTPVVGASLFGENANDVSTEDEEVVDRKRMPLGPLNLPMTRPKFEARQPGFAAEIIVNGEVFKIRVNDETLRGLRRGFSGDMLDSHGISVNGMTIQADSSNIVGQLKGFVRNDTLAHIQEESVTGSDTSSIIDA